MPPAQNWLKGPRFPAGGLNFCVDRRGFFCVDRRGFFCVDRRGFAEAPAAVAFDPVGLADLPKSPDSARVSARDRLSLSRQKRRQRAQIVFGLNG